MVGPFRPGHGSASYTALVRWLVCLVFQLPPRSLAARLIESSWPFLEGRTQPAMCAGGSSKRVAGPTELTDDNWVRHH